MTPLEKEVITNDQLLQEFAEHLEQTGKTKHTVRAYIADVRKLADFVQRTSQVDNLANAPGDIIEAYIRESGGSASSDSTVKRQVMSLRRFFSFLVDRKFIQTNPISSVTVAHIPAEAIPVDKLERAFRYLCNHQVSATPLECARYRRDELILVFMLFLGIRQYQIPALKISGLKKENGSYSISTGSNDRHKLDSNTLQLLHAYLKSRQSNGDTIFVDPTSKKPVTPANLRTLMTELSYSASSPINPKSIRHTFEHFQSNPSEADQLLRSIADMHLRREAE